MAASFSTLIGARELAHQAGPDWRIFDCRHDLANPEFGRAAYAEAHIPGALFLHLDEDLSGPVTGLNGRHPLPDPALLAAKLGALGVTSTTQVVAYDDAGGMFAARLWWLLRWLGHHCVAVLDGGLQAWRRSGLALNDEVLQPESAIYEVHPQASCKADADEVRDALGTGAMLLIDARSPDRFRGENETLDPVGGHIPGAVNRFFRTNLGADGCFKQAAVLREEFGELLHGVDAHHVVHQCGSGVTACHNLLAMEAAGFPGSKLYPGSWSEWCADPARPVATGER